MRVELNVIEGPAKGQHFTFDKADCFLFGRSVDAHISLPEDRYVSRQHFLLEISPPECKLTDLNSKNGVFVNGMRYGGRKPPKVHIKQAPNGVKEVRLKDGDEITVGDTRIKFFIQPDRTASGRDALANEKTPLVTKSSAKLLNISGYEIEREIGRGHIGVVYKATESKTGKPVAIKIVSPRMKINPYKVKLFQRELDVICQIRHKHIVRFFKHEHTKGVYYFIFEFVDGLDLAKFLQARGGCISMNEAGPILLEILEGLAYAHRVKITLQTSGGQHKTFKGIVHRNLKPQNILLARQGNLWFSKIADFGLSKGLESAGFTNITTPEGLSTTPMYWPREQITHYSYPDPASDVFSIAAVFYEMLTGVYVREGFQKLFDKSIQTGCLPAISDYLKVIAANPPIPIRQRNRNIPEPLAEVIDKALRETEIPQDRVKMREVLKTLRYPDAGAFRSALLKAFKEVGVPESSKSTLQKYDDIPWEGVTGKERSIEQVSAGTVIYSAIKPTVRRNVALLVLDLVQSTQYVLDVGDTSFSTLIGNIYRRVKAHSSASELIFLKCTGDGFLMVFYTISTAFSLASTFLETPVHPDIHVRMALHWGAIKTGPHGDVLGTEVHRACRIEGVKLQDQIDTAGYEGTFPTDDRILVSRKGLEQLNTQDKAKFGALGKFRLKGFKNPCELWVYSI